jgi:hypothetical protein
MNIKVFGFEEQMNDLGNWSSLCCAHYLFSDIELHCVEGIIINGSSWLSAVSIWLPTKQ